MGETTPNISIYIPSPGETNYDQSFAAGMVNIDQHDHSGGPNKGVPLSGSGIADGAITYQKLNPNVADVSTGIGTQGGSFSNRLEILGILRNLFQLATPAGFLAKNGSAVTARTIQGTAGQVVVTNGDGVGGDPVISLPAAIAPSSGTFLPVLSFGGASVGITYSKQSGKYWKIGNVVFFNINIILTNKGSSVGNSAIGGLPFVSSNDGQTQAITVEAFLGTYPALATYIVAELDPNQNSVVLAACGAGTQSGVTDVNFANNTDLTLSGFYWIA